MDAADNDPNAGGQQHAGKAGGAPGQGAG